MAKPSVSKPELRVVTAHADVLSPLAGTGDIGSLYGRQPALTDRQRDYDENWRKILVEWKGSRSFENFAEELRSHGMKVTAQSIHKWFKGGGINTVTAKDLADIRGMAVDEFLYGRPAAITEEQRAFWELFAGLTKKQQEETFRKLFKMRNQQTAAKAEEEINQ